MNIKASGELSYYSFRSLEPWPALTQAAFTRLGGVSAPPYDSLNVSLAVQDDPASVRTNRDRMARSVGWEPTRLVSAHQVHGKRVAAVETQMIGMPDLPDTDALVTAEPGVLLMLKFADCVPIILWDPVREVVALVHAGWRGTVLGTPAAALELMTQRFGTQPSDVVAGIGPSIGPCCYDVGGEVVTAASRAFAGASVILDVDGSRRFDLWSANAETLMRSGVAEESIEIAAICTRCHHDLFFSHRAAGGIAGRFGVVAGIRGG